MGEVMDVSLALDRYDRHFPFFDGTVASPPGLNLRVLQVGQSTTLRDGNSRHNRMLEGEFDIAEFSMSSFLMAIDRGLPLTGIPVFPRRLFSAGLFFVAADSSIQKPADLEGRRVAISSFQTTLSLLAKGDLKFEYDVPWESITWVVSAKEKVAFVPKPGVRIETLPARTDLGLCLKEGKVDAVVAPHPPHSILSGAVRVRRLFADSQAEELRYFRKYGYFPIMHILAIRKDLVAREPWLVQAVMGLFADAHRIAADYYSDPNWSSLVWGRKQFEWEREQLGFDPWVMGVEENRSNLERMIAYSVDQGLVRSSLGVADLFPAGLCGH